MSVGNVDSFVKVFYKLFEAFLSDQNLVCPEKTHDIKTVTIMPNDSSEISLSQLKVLINFFSSDHTKDTSFISHMIFVSISYKFSLPLSNSFIINNFYLTLG